MGMSSKKKEIGRIKKQARVFAIMSLGVSAMTIILMFYVLFTTGNMLLMLPVIFVSGFINVLTVSKMQDLLMEIDVIEGKRDHPGDTLVDSLLRDARVAGQMVVDKEFWKILFEDIIEAIREAKEKVRK